MIEARELRLWEGRYDLLKDGRWVAIAVLRTHWSFHAAAAE